MRAITTIGKYFHVQSSTMYSGLNVLSIWYCSDKFICDVHVIIASPLLMITICRHICLCKSGVLC